MIKLYYSTCGFSAPHIGVVIDDVIKSVKSGDEVIWAYCHNALTSCWVNRDGNKQKCRFCHIMYNEYKRSYCSGFRMLPIKKSDIRTKEIEITIKDSGDVRNFEYRNVKVGLSILSTYYNFTRDMDLKNFNIDGYCVPLMKEMCRFIDYCYNLITLNKPDEIVVVNGRHFSNRMFYDISQQFGIQFKSLEVAGSITDPPFRKMSYKNELPHSISLRTEIIERLWDESPETIDEKKNIADHFYGGRRAGALVADVKSYTANQEKGLLPPDFDSNLRNISIFNSSADEFAALGGEWDEDILFSSQYEAIEFLLKNSPHNYHYYLRIHPNLEGMDFKAHTELYNLSKYDNITIIKPADKISTYSLLDACEKTLSFGSTMGVEACYWGKASIMIGHAWYEKLNVCYIPHSRGELINLITKKGLMPKPKDGAQKYAYFILDRSHVGESSDIDIQVRSRKIVYSFLCTPYFKLYGSSWLFQVAYLYFVRFADYKQRLFDKFCGNR